MLCCAARSEVHNNQQPSQLLNCGAIPCLQLDVAGRSNVANVEEKKEKRTCRTCDHDVVVVNLTRLKDARQEGNWVQ